MNQSINKLANLLVARKAIQTLPTAASLTLPEFNAIMLECHGNSAAAIDTVETVTSALKPTSTQEIYGVARETPEIFHPRHANQAPLSITNTMVTSHHTQLDSSPSARFQVSIRGLSSSTTKKH